MDNRGIALKNIHSYLAIFTSQVVQQNASGKFDINKDAENIAINLLNELLRYQLQNANNLISVNFPSIDLVDEANQVAYQITSTTGSDKITGTLEKFVSEKLYEKYPNLYIYIITKKKERYNKSTIDRIKEIVGDKFEFDINKNIIDNIVLGKQIDAILDMKQILNIESILEYNFGNIKTRIPLLKEKKNDQPRFKLNYRNRSTGFIGRKKELIELMSFFSADSDFSWWIISGKAGSGKSRLALEFGYELDKFGVEWGFIQSDQLDKFDWERNYARPILIIYDYVQAEFQKAIHFIKNLSTKTSFARKFGVLFIEREVSGYWWKRFLNDIDIASSLHKEVPLETSGLSLTNLSDIVEQVVLSENSTIRYNRNEVESFLVHLDALQRPLFAMFVGLAIANGQYINNWNQHNLLDFIIDSDLKLARKVYNEYSDDIIQKHRNLLALATVCNGINAGFLRDYLSKGFSWLPTSDQFDNELYRYISGGSVVESSESITSIMWFNKEDNAIALHPLLPNILGEYYVLKNLEIDERFKYRDLDRIDQFMKLLMPLNHIFLRKILQDFPLHRNTLILLKGSDDSFFNSRGSSGYLVLQAMKSIYWNNLKVLEVLWNYTKELNSDSDKKMTKRIFIDSPDRVFQEACKIMVYSYNSDFQNQKRYYEIMKSNTDHFDFDLNTSFDSNPRTYISPYSETDHMMMPKINTANEDDAKKYIDEMIVVDARIPHLESIAIDCMLRKENVGEQNEIAQAFITRLFELCKLFSDPRIKVVTLEAIINYGIDKIEFVNSLIHDLFINILDTPRQVSPINVEFQKFLFLKIYVEYAVTQNQDGQAFSYFMALLVRCEKGVPDLRYYDTFINLANLAKDLSKYYYEKRMRVQGDDYYRIIMRINIPFSKLDENPILKTLMQMESLRNGY